MSFSNEKIILTDWEHNFKVMFNDITDFVVILNDFVGLPDRDEFYISTDIINNQDKLFDTELEAKNFATQNGWQNGFVLPYPVTFSGITQDIFVNNKETNKLSGSKFFIIIPKNWERV